MDVVPKINDGASRESLMRTLSCTTCGRPAESAAGSPQINQYRQRRRFPSRVWMSCTTIIARSSGPMLKMSSIHLSKIKEARMMSGCHPPTSMYRVHSIATRIKSSGRLLLLERVDESHHAAARRLPATLFGLRSPVPPATSAPSQMQQSRPPPGPEAPLRLNMVASRTPKDPNKRINIAPPTTSKARSSYATPWSAPWADRS